MITYSTKAKTHLDLATRLEQHARTIRLDHQGGNVAMLRVMMDAGMSCEKVAQKAGLTGQGVWYVLKGHRKPTPYTRAAIARALDVPESAIFQKEAE